MEFTVTKWSKGHKLRGLQQVFGSIHGGSSSFVLAMTAKLNLLAKYLGVFLEKKLFLGFFIRNLLGISALMGWVGTSREY